MRRHGSCAMPPPLRPALALRPPPRLSGDILSVDTFRPSLRFQRLAARAADKTLQDRSPAFERLVATMVKEWIIRVVDHGHAVSFQIGEQRTCEQTAWRGLAERLRQDSCSKVANRAIPKKI